MARRYPCAMRRSTQILLAAIGFMLGIMFVKLYGSVSQPLLLAWATVTVVLAMLLRKSQLLYIPILLLAFAAGMLRQDLYSAFRPSATIDDLQYSRQTIEGTVVGEPYRDDKTNMVFYLTSLRVGGRPVEGDLRVKSLVGNTREGYRVQAVGKVLPSLGKTSSSISYAKVTVFSTRQGLLVQTKSEFSKGLRRALPEPAASFMLGILIGARSTLPKDLQTTMALIGLSHLVAVSGYNLTIISLAVQRLLGKKWQWAGLVATLWLIVGFVLLTGASASIVRAGIMSTLFLLSTYYGRRLEVLTCLALGIIITLGWDPSYINDLGWQLSFLALAGIVLLTPVIRSFTPKRFGVVGEIVAVSIAAQLATVPLIAFTFGTVSIIAPLANMIVLPMVPLLMAAGFIAGVMGMLLPAAAVTVASPIAWLANGLIDGMRYLGSLPAAAVEGAAPTLAVVTILYGLLILLSVFARQRDLGSRTANVIITGMKREAVK